MPTAATSPEKTATARAGAPLLWLCSAWATLFVFWLLLSGFFTAFLITAGAGCAAFAVWFGHRMQVIDREGHPIHLSLRACAWYWPWLIKEIVKSAWDVSKVILNPRLPISPTVVRFKPSQRTDVGLVTHANSITLTPGTMCIEAKPDEFVVHALTSSGAAGVGAGSDMDLRVSRFEGQR